MNLSPLLRVPETERLKCAIILSPFALFFLAVGVICGIDYLHQIHFRGPGWLIPAATLAALHLVSSALAYLALWHRSRSHISIQGSALLITFLFSVFAAIVCVLIVGIH